MKSKKHHSSVLSKSSFSKCLSEIGTRFSLATVFDDFLTLSIAACTQNPKTGKSYYEEEYLATIDKYKDSELRHEFSKAFGALVIEMEEGLTALLGNDVLGEFFEENISNGRNGQFFTPQPICDLMASMTSSKMTEEKNRTRPLRILDPSCGSGRVLVSSYRRFSIGNEYYGIDIDLVCIKMAAINLFLNGVWQSEVMCANALLVNDFVVSYRISLFPLGIFKITEKEKSKLWHMHQNSFKAKTPDVTPPSTDGTQMDLFTPNS